MKEFEPGYHKLAGGSEKLCWESDEWSSREWEVICDILGLPAAETTSIAVKIDSLEYHIEKGKKSPNPVKKFARRFMRG